MNWQPIDTAPTRKEVIVYHKIAAKYGGTPWLVAWKDEKGAWHDDYQNDGFLVGAEHLTHWHDLTDPR